ncbi:MAG TPA: hypothetical protein DEA08_15785 [Planctomycetes bacterium]|nr:hypothetical protein [Planctomycetota bacterium]
MSFALAGAMKIQLHARAGSALRCPGCHDDLHAGPPPAETAPPPAAPTPRAAPWHQGALPWLSFGISLFALGWSLAPQPARAPRSHHCCRPQPQGPQQPLRSAQARPTSRGLTWQRGRGVVFYEPQPSDQPVNMEPIGR